MIVADTPGTRVFMADVTGPRIMPDGCDMAGSTIGCATVVVTDFSPIIGIMTTLAQSWIVVCWCVMATAAQS